MKEIKSKKNSFLMGTLILGVAGVIIKILGAIFRIPLANFIGAEGMGYYQTAYPVYALFLTLATAGFPTAIAKLVSEQVALGNHKQANRIFKITHIMLFITGFVTFLVLFFGAEYIVSNVQHNPNAVTAMKAIAPALLIVPSMSAYRGYYQGYQQMSKIAISQIVEQTFRVLLGLLLAYVLMSKFGPIVGAAGGISGATIGAFASFLFLLLVYLKDSRERRNLISNSIDTVEDFSRENILKDSIASYENLLDTSENFLKRLGFKIAILSKKINLKMGIIGNILEVVIPISIGAAVMPLVNVVDSIIVIARLKEAGFTTLAANSLLGQLTGMAMPIIVMPMIFTTAIGMSLVPAISEAYTLKKFNDARKNAKMAFKITLLLVLPCAFGLASLSVPIMSLLFPKQNPEVVGLILFTLAPACIFLGLLYTFNGILQGMGKPMIPVYALLCGILAKVVISYVFTALPSINILGSAFGTVASYIIAAAFEYKYIKKYLKIEFDIMEYFIRPILIVMIMFVGTKMAYAGMNFVAGNKISTLIAIMVGGAIYIVLLFALGGITQEEILSMPKGNKILAKLKKMKLVR